MSETIAFTGKSVKLFKGHYTSSSGRSFVDGAGTTFADLAQSFYWAGIESVTVGGQIIDYELFSDSGIDWRNSMAPVFSDPTAIPEPGTLALMSLGLLGIGLQRMAGLAKA